MRVKASGWIFVLVTAIAPVLVAAITITQTDIPKTDPLLGNLAPPINPWLDNLPMSIIPATLLGIVGWLIAFIPTRPGFKTSRPLIKVTIIGNTGFIDACCSLGRACIRTLVDSFEILVCTNARFSHHWLLGFDIRGRVDWWHCLVYVYVCQTDCRRISPFHHKLPYFGRYFGRSNSPAE